MKHIRKSNAAKHRSSRALPEFSRLMAPSMASVYASTLRIAAKMNIHGVVYVRFIINHAAEKGLRFQLDLGIKPWKVLLQCTSSDKANMAGGTHPWI